MTIDVEEYFQVSALAPVIPESSWDGRESRVERTVDRLLAMLAERGQSATFFTLGWIAERHPALIRRMVAGGHEIASHGWCHQRVTAQDRATFAADVSRTRALLQDLSGQPVIGYRAASFSIDATVPWAYDVLAEAGYAYSSSAHPIPHDHYGEAHAPRGITRKSSGIVEYPVSTVRVGARNLPCAGGGWFRLLPYALSRIGMQAAARQIDAPLMFYFHPWEIDPGQPRVAGIPARTRFRHYVNLARFEAKFARLLDDFRWDRVDRQLAAAGHVGEIA